MDSATVRLWATEQLWWWPNRLHVLAIVLYGSLALMGWQWQHLVVEAVLVGWLVWRIHQWDQQRRRRRPLRVRVR